MRDHLTNLALAAIVGLQIRQVMQLRRAINILDAAALDAEYEALIRAES